MNTPTLSQLADIGAKAACVQLDLEQDDSDGVYIRAGSPGYDGEAPAREAFVQAVLDAVGYKFPVDPEREAYDAWVTTAGWDLRDSPFEAWKAGRAYALDNQPERRDALYKEMRERFKAEEQKDMQALENARAAKPAPETFEAHGLTWFKHTPGDPMPCDGDAKINWLLSREKGEGEYTHWDKLAKEITWNGPLDVIGWRYATADAP